MDLFNVLFILQSGIYWTELCAYYNAGWAVLLMGMAEAIVFAWVYGVDTLSFFYFIPFIKKSAKFWQF